jgi:hypothetical protein
MQGGQETVIPEAEQTPMLTVWRTLWMELGDMVAPTLPGDGPFDGAGQGNDDVQMDPGTPPIALAQSSMAAALVRVLALPAQYNVKDAFPADPTGTARFVHNMTSTISSSVSGPVRDQASKAAFWVVHTIGAYEERAASIPGHPGGDWDPNGEANSWLGWAYQYGADGSNFIFYETIRDRQANDPPAEPRNPVDLTTLTQRGVLHEALHRFLGAHGTEGTGADEGIMLYDTAIYGNAQENALTPHQINLVQQKTYPK